MNELLSEIQNNVFIITLNRVLKHNAFDDKLLEILLKTLVEAIENPDIRIIMLRANGQHFSAGADAAWMQRMAQFTEEENLADALVLARVMQTIYQSPKPTLAVVQGAAMGGGAGLVAACDIAIASESARFCFSEVKLGLIPAIISPYVVNAIGAKASKWLFTSAETINAPQAHALQLVQHVIADDKLMAFATDYAARLVKLAPQAMQESKQLVNRLSPVVIDDKLIYETAHLIAKKRVSAEGQKGLNAFLNKTSPIWS